MIHVLCTREIVRVHMTYARWTKVLQKWEHMVFSQKTYLYMLNKISVKKKNLQSSKQKFQLFQIFSKS